MLFHVIAGALVASALWAYFGKGGDRSPRARAVLAAMRITLVVVAYCVGYVISISVRDIFVVFAAPLACLVAAAYLPLLVADAIDGKVDRPGHPKPPEPKR